MKNSISFLAPSPKINLLFFLSFIAGAFTINAQSFNNSSFEVWSTNQFFDDPNGFISTNYQTYIYNANGNVEKISPAFSGNHHIKLTTVAADTDTIPGAIFIGMPNGNILYGGVPFNSRPDSVIGFSRYNLMMGDTASMIVLFKNNTVPVGFARISFFGSQANFTRFSFPVLWVLPQSPDSLSSFIISSNTDYPAIPGSQIELDNIAFVDSNAAVFPNGDFEAWTSIQSLEPDGWNSINFVTLSGTPSVTQSTDAYDGNYSARIETVITPYGDTLGFLTNGELGSTLLQGGMPVSQNPMMISGFYKYNPVGPDTGLIGGFTTKYDNVFGTTVRLDSTLFQFETANNWTSFSMNFIYNGFPIVDTLNVSISSSNIENDGNFIGVGSVLLIDKLEVFYNPVGEPQPVVFAKNATGVYWDDSGNLFFRQNSNQLSEGFLYIYDGSGRLVVNQKINESSTQSVDFSQWTPGIYSYRFVGRKISNGKFTFVR